MRDYLSPYFNADSDIAFDVVTSKVNILTISSICKKNGKKWSYGKVSFSNG